MGGQIIIPEEYERELAVNLELKAKWGFAATRDEVRDIVSQCVKANKEEDNEFDVLLRK